MDHQSRLIGLFTESAGNCSSPERSIISAVTNLRRGYRKGGTPEQRLRYYLRSRKIKSLQLTQELISDGALQPIGIDYSHGFQLLLSSEKAASRMRFTIAHEICHTFFYELVPEIKFFPHDVDEKEERLCDLGAAELLMPASSVQKVAPHLAVCIESLCTLATEFSVSVTAMFLRLRFLRLWNCVFSEWHRMVDGNFALVNFYGGKTVPWEWEDESILQDAWHGRKTIFGNTLVRYSNEQGDGYYYPARFEIRRFGNKLVSLWGSEIEDPVSHYPLFETDIR